MNFATAASLTAVPLSPAMSDLAPALAAYALKTADADFLRPLNPTISPNFSNPEGDAIAAVDEFLRVAPDSPGAGGVYARLEKAMAGSSRFKAVGEILTYEARAGQSFQSVLDPGTVKKLQDRIASECRPIIERHLDEITQKLHQDRIGVRIPVGSDCALAGIPLYCSSTIVHDAFRAKTVANLAERGLADELLTRAFAGAMAQSMNRNVNALGEIPLVALSGKELKEDVLGLVGGLSISALPLLSLPGTVVLALIGGAIAFFESVLLAGDAYFAIRTSALRNLLGLKTAVPMDKIVVLREVQEQMRSEYSTYAQEGLQGWRVTHA